MPDRMAMWLCARSLVDTAPEIKSFGIGGGLQQELV